MQRSTNIWVIPICHQHLASTPTVWLLPFVSVLKVQLQASLKPKDETSSRHRCQTVLIAPSKSRAKLKSVRTRQEQREHLLLPAKAYVANGHTDAAPLAARSKNARLAHKLSLRQQLRLFLFIVNFFEVTLNTEAILLKSSTCKAKTNRPYGWRWVGSCTSKEKL